jgi:outer membrane immunogenic protein
MKRALLIGISALAVIAAGQANAADMYVPAPAGSLKDGPYLPADSWTGLYLGVNGGYGWGASSDLFSYPAANNGRIAIPAFGGIDPKGWFGGGQIGHNWQGVLQNPHLVLGLEADIQASDISASATDFDTPASTWKSSAGWFGTVRGRLGYAFGGTLLYATGGLAYGHVSNSYTLPATHIHGVETFQFDGIATGYAAGGGTEFKIAPAWSVKSEYQYINLGEHDPTWAGHSVKQAFAGIKVDDNAFHTVRLGLNYHIGSDAEPLK